MKFAHLAGWVFFGWVSATSVVYAQNSITALSAGVIGDGTTVVKVELAQSLENLPTGFTTDTPPRIVLDFSDTTNGLGRSVQDFTGGGVRSANVVQASGRTRLVINLDRMLAYNTVIDGNNLSISLRDNAIDARSKGFHLAETKQEPAKVVQEVRKPTAAEVQTKSPTTSLAQPGPIPANEALGALLREADMLLKGGKPVDAYNLLEPKEGDYSGEIAFDYLLGIAALDSGKPDRATIAFERVLAVNPNFAGARLDLARAYFAMGSDDLAKKEFETVLALNPPEPTAAVINRHLEAIAERQLAKKQRLATYLEVSVGHDDNITAATPDNVGGVSVITGIPKSILVQVYQPTGSSLHYSGMYENVSAGADFSRVLDEENGISFFAGADAKQRIYNRVPAMNNLTLDLRAGAAMVSGEDSYRLTGTFSQYRQSGFIAGINGFRDTTGLSAEWKRSFGTRDQMTWTLGFSQPRYLTSPAQNTRQTSLGASWLHIFEGEMTPLIFANLNHSVDRAVQPLNTAGTHMGRTSTGVLAHFQFTPLADTDVFLSGGVTVRRDDSPGARSSPALPDFYARDETQSLSFGVTTRPWEKWSVKGSVALTKNRSNLSLFRYRRNDTSISVRRDF